MIQESEPFEAAIIANRFRAAPVAGRTLSMANLVDDISLPDHHPEPRARMKQAGLLRRVVPVVAADHEIIDQRQTRFAITLSTADQAIPLAGGDIVDQCLLRSVAKAYVHGITQPATVIGAVHVAVSAEKAAIANDCAVTDPAGPGCLDLVAGISLDSSPLDRDPTTIGQLKQVDAIGGVVVHPAIFEFPVTTGGRLLQKIKFSLLPCVRSITRIMHR